MINASLNIAWSIAEIEASMAGFESILPAHFWIGCCKGCDLDYEKFLRKAKPEVQAMEGRIARDFQVFRDALAKTMIKPLALRRGLRVLLGKPGGPKRRPLQLSPELRTAFVAGKRLAETVGAPMQPVHVLHGLLQQEDPMFQECLAGLGADGRHLAKALDACVFVVDAGLDDQKANANRKPGGNQPAVRAKNKSILTQFGRDLNRLAKDGKLSPVIGRKAEMLKIAQALLQSRKNNVLLVGEPGVGKTGIVEGLAQRIVEGKVPADLQSIRIIELSMSLLVAGTKYRGEFEERLQAVIKEFSADPSIVVFLDEIHTLMGAGKAGGSMDAANILKPALARGDIRVIGATTIAEYRLHIEKDAAIERRFQKIDIEEPSADETLEILHGLRSRMEEHHGIKISDGALAAAIEWSVRYLPDFRLPDKAIDLVDTACAQARFLTFSSRGGKSSIDRLQIANAVASRCKIPVGALTEDEGTRLLSMEVVLGKRVKGQEAAIKSISEAVRLARSGLNNPRRPMGSFLFVGPSGTGKTELAKTLSEFLFHNESALIRFDMSEFMEEHSVSKLIGAPPGYKGCDEEGQLTGKIRTRPYSVVLFDEIEKAHPRVLDLFLQIFDEGTLTDANGRKCDFRNALIILTSNLGTARVTRKKEVGFGAKPEGLVEIQARQEEQIQVAIKAHLRPELVNRLSAIVQFQSLQPEHIRQIIEKCVTALNVRLEERQITLTLSPEVLELIAKEGFSPEFGARELERTFERIISKPLAEAILQGSISSGNAVLVEALSQGVAFRRVCHSDQTRP